MHAAMVSRLDRAAFMHHGDKGYKNTLNHTAALKGLKVTLCGTNVSPALELSLPEGRHFVPPKRSLVVVSG